MPKNSRKMAPERLISATEGAAILGVSLTWVTRLVREGYIRSAAPRLYRVVDVVQGYIRWLKDEERRSSKVQAESGLKAARQREVELRIAEKEGRLIDVEYVDAFFAHNGKIFREELAPVPREATRDPAMQKRIGEALTAAVDRFESRYRVAREAMRAGRDPLDS